MVITVALVVLGFAWIRAVVWCIDRTPQPDPMHSEPSHEWEEYKYWSGRMM